MPTNYLPTARPFRPTSWAISVLLIIGVGVFGVACSDDPPTSLPGDPAGDPPGYTDPAALVLAHAAALETQMYAKYEKLVAEDFEYFPQSEDLTDFPWLQEQISWGRADELQMVAHMFDDAFQAADYSAGTVDTIDAQLTVVGQHVESDGSRVVNTNAAITVRYPSGRGARADVRLEFLLVAGPDGYLRIRSIRERPPYLRDGGDDLELATWARIKGSYLVAAAP